MLWLCRLAEQADRQSRMQGRWYHLKNELFLIQQIRETKQKRAQISSAFVSLFFILKVIHCVCHSLAVSIVRICCTFV